MCAATLASIGEARGQSPTTGAPQAITYRAPGKCPDQAWLIAQISRYLGKAPEGVKADIDLAKEGRGWRVTVRTHTRAGEGEVTHHGADCSVLADVAALIVALAIDPTAGPGKKSAKAKPANAKQPEPEPIAPPPGAHDAEVPPDPHLRLTDRRGARAPIPPGGPIPDAVIRARFMLASDIGSLPSPALAVGVGAHGQVGPWLADLGIWASNQTGAEMDQMPGAGADFRLLAADGRICREVLNRLGHWSPCLGLEIGQIFASSYGVDNTVDTRTRWVSPVGGLSVAWNLTRSINIRIDNQIGANLIRERFRLAGTFIHQANPVHWRASVGLERSFR